MKTKTETTQKSELGKLHTHLFYILLPFTLLPAKCFLSDSDRNTIKQKSEWKITETQGSKMLNLFNLSNHIPRFPVHVYRADRTPILLSLIPPESHPESNHFSPVCSFVFLPITISMSPMREHSNWRYLKIRFQHAPSLHIVPQLPEEFLLIWRLLL